MKKNIIKIIVIGMLFNLSINANVTEDKKVVEKIGTIKKEAVLIHEKEETQKNINDKISKRTNSKIIFEEICFNNTNISLYAQFENQDLALNEFKEKYKNNLTYIKNKNNLEEINEQNWLQYYGLIKDLPIDNQTISQKEERDMLFFFDIFENAYQNKEIKDICSKNDSKLESLSNSEKDTLFRNLNILLPYTSNQLPVNPILKQTTGINFTKAYAYATKYATSPNYSYYPYYEGADCTNFVSQVLVAGGIAQTSTYDLDPNSGWWHTTRYDSTFGTLHYSSKSWRIADTFAKYMGIYYTTKNHYNFSAAVSTGDIIGFDDPEDGDWNHMAFVVDSDSYAATYGSKKYYDYKIAQHSKNYLAWVSSSTCGWEELEDQDYTYGIIRR